MIYLIPEVLRKGALHYLVIDILNYVRITHATCPMTMCQPFQSTIIGLKGASPWNQSNHIFTHTGIDELMEFIANHPPGYVTSLSKMKFSYLYLLLLMGSRKCLFTLCVGITFRAPCAITFRTWKFRITLCVGITFRNNPLLHYA